MHQSFHLSSSRFSLFSLHTLLTFSTHLQAIILSNGCLLSPISAHLLGRVHYGAAVRISCFQLKENFLSLFLIPTFCVTCPQTEEDRGPLMRPAEVLFSSETAEGARLPFLKSSENKTSWSSEGILLFPDRQQGKTTNVGMIHTGNVAGVSGYASSVLAPGLLTFINSASLLYHLEQ